MSIIQRVAHRFAARPIHIDKREIRNFVTNELMPDIQRWARRRPADEPIGSRDLVQTTLRIETSDGRSTIDVVVLVRSRPSGHQKVPCVPGGGFGKAGTKPVIVLNLNGNLTAGDLVEGRYVQPLWECTHETCIPYSLYSILIHEATHAAESIFPTKSRIPLNKKNPGETPEDVSDAEMVMYVNDSKEVRAFMQQVVDEVLRYAEMPAIRGVAQKNPRPNQKLVELILKLSTSWKGVEKHLSGSNRAKILKAVYDALDRQNLLLTE